VTLVSRVTQGCKPVSKVRAVTAAERDLVLTLDGQPALDLLLADLGVSLGRPQQAPEAVRATLVGLSQARHCTVHARQSLAARCGCDTSWAWIRPARRWRWAMPWLRACRWRFASAMCTPRDPT